MKHKRKPLFTSKAVLLSVLVFIIGATVVITLGYNAKKGQDELNRSKVELNATTCAQRIQLDIMQGINITNTLEQVIISDDGEIQKFSEIAEDAEEVNREIFKDFIRYQNVTKCWRKENGKWIIKDAPFIDDWTEKDYQTLIFCLKNTIASDGFVYAAFYDGKLKGFVSVESEIFGGKQGYCDLSSIHISEDMRRKGIGRTLFLAAKEWAKQKGAKKLYISAHSAVESQAFYKSMGCVEAEVYNQKHVEDEPYDCQLECVL